MTSGPIPTFAAMVQTAALAMQRAPPGLTPAQLEDIAARKVVGLWHSLAQDRLQQILSAASLAVFAAAALQAGDYRRYDAAAAALATPSSGNVWVTALVTFTNPQVQNRPGGRATSVRTIQVEVNAGLAGEIVAQMIDKITERWEGDSAAEITDVQVVSVIGGE